MEQENHLLEKKGARNKIIISSTNNINEINRNTWVSDHNGLISKFTPIDVNSDMFKEIAQTIYGRFFNILIMINHYIIHYLEH